MLFFVGTGGGTSAFAVSADRSSLQLAKRLVFNGRPFSLSLPTLCSQHGRFAGRMGFEIISLDGSLLLGLEPSDERPAVLGRSLMETMAFDESENLDSEDGHDIVLVKLCPSSGVFLWTFDTISARVFIVYAVFVHIKGS